MWTGERMARVKGRGELASFESMRNFPECGEKSWSGIDFFLSRGSNVIHNALKMSSTLGKKKQTQNWLIQIFAYLGHPRLAGPQLQRTVLTNPRHPALGGGCPGFQLIPGRCQPGQCYLSDG